MGTLWGASLGQNARLCDENGHLKNFERFLSLKLFITYVTHKKGINTFLSNTLNN